MNQIIFFPIRHHSPACAFHIKQKILEQKPKHILIEGPSDANHLLPFFLEPDLKLPLAIYAYKQSDQPERLYYPLCDYSPELVGIQTGAEIGANCLFIDLPSAAMMDIRDQSEIEKDPLWESGTSKYTQTLAQKAGYERFEDFWEATFEMSGFHKSSHDFWAEMAWYGQAIRELEEEDGLISEEILVREAFMAAQIRQVAKEYPGESIAVICGAAHHQALMQALEQPPLQQLKLPDTPSAEITLIPYSFTRLSEQSGYGAGNQAPRFYQLAWEHQGDFSHIFKVILLEQLKQLRRNGFTTNLSHAIEAGKLAQTLSAIRNKPTPGVKEMIDATTSCYGEGQSERLHVIWQQTLIGSTVGVLPNNVAQTPLQREFYSEVQRLGIPLEDIPKPLNLSLTNPSDQEISIFLHRLRIAGMSYGHLQISKNSSYQMLTAVRERWEVAWTPTTDTQLIEQTAYGSNFAEVCAYHLNQKLRQAAYVHEVTEALLEISLTQLEGLWQKALRLCEEFSSEDRNFAALCQSVHHIFTLLKYGTTRQLHDLDALKRLLEKLFLRAVWTLLPATVVSTEGVHEVIQGLQILNEVNNEMQVGEAHFVHILRKVIQKVDAHPTIRGFSISLLYLLQKVTDEELEIMLYGWLHTEPQEMTQLIQGLFRLNLSFFIRKPGLIGAIHSFVQSLGHEDFVQLLPMLRGVFSMLSPMDQRNLAGTLSKILQIETAETQALSSQFIQRDHNQMMDAQLATIVERWKSEYGLS